MEKIILLDQNDFANDALFSQLQGNILKGHGRDFTTNIFIKFEVGREKEVKKWIVEFAEKNITSCKKQLKENELYKRNKVNGGIFCGFMLTALGYTYLGKSTDKFETSFINGMENADLKDPEKRHWEKGFRDIIHAMILIGDDNQEKLAEFSREVVAELDMLGVITTIENGIAIRNQNRDGIEHFGYVDGISQPLFFEDEIKKYIEQNGNINNFNPSANKDLVLFNDPLIDKKDAYGSYFVFRKLEQNVRKFKRDELKLADVLDLKGEDRERAGALIVGRFEDGTPIEVSNEEGMIGSGAFNNFKYGNDNSKCPFHAHIRKSNPRQDRDHEIDDHKSRIMARRGIPYGKVTNNCMDEDPDYHQLPEEGVGLLFMSFQKSISKQFEFIQKSWVNEIDFPNIHNGIDPVIGQIKGKNDISLGVFPKKYGDNSPGNFVIAPFETAVTMKGGEYFFAPSIPFLKNLK